MGRFAGEFRQIENRIFEYGAGAGAARRFVGHEFVVCAVPLSIHRLIPRTSFCAKSRVHFVNARKLLMTLLAARKLLISMTFVRGTFAAMTFARRTELTSSSRRSA